MDYFFWGYAKHLVYSVRMNDPDPLRIRIRDACQEIVGDSDFLNRVFHNFHHRLNLCVAAGGQHFEHL